MEKLAVGIDLGGTSIKGVLMGKDGRCRHLTRVPTEAHKGGKKMLENILALVERIVAREGAAGRIIGVGIGTPGFVSREGVVSGAGNLPGWEGTQVCRPISERFGVKAVAANDVTVMALAEARYGAGRGVANMVCYALGTGIGGGLVIGHRIYAGTHGMAGELGHVPVETGGIRCSCGQAGCVERYASAAGIVAAARELAALENNAGITPFVKIVRADPDALTAKTVYEFVAKGDPMACAVNERACEMLARAIGMTISTLSPDRVVLGGGVMMAGQVIIDTVKKYLPCYTIKNMLDECDIVAAELGEDAGVIGAATMVFDS